jgi:hypothetical protein
MNLINLILQNKLIEANIFLKSKIEKILKNKLEEEKKNLVENFINSETLLELVKRNPNIIKMGRINKIRRRIRRNVKGKIVVQKNRRRSGIKGYKISGNRVVRIPAVQRLRKARLLKRSWKTTRRAKLRRSLLKRKLSMRRRSSLGLR